MVNPDMKRILLAAALAGCVALSGCIVAPVHGRPYAGPVVWAPVAPPPLRVETPPPPPHRDYLWIPGYWHWETNQHRWVDGHWEAPREHQHWEPHRWDRDEGGRWRLREGYWRRD